MPWSDISEAFTYTYEVDTTVENITSDPLASKTAGEVSVISDVTDHSPNAFHASPSPVDASHIDSGARADALDSAASRSSIDTASTVPDADDQALDASHESASISLTIFAESTPACIEGRLVPPPILLWLRSRLATDEECSVSTVLTIAWWQPILMRILPLNPKSTVMNYRLHSKPSTSYLKSASWWRGISTKNPSADQLDRVCGDYRLVYLRTTDVLNAGELKSSLRQHHSFTTYRVLAIFPFAIDLWEILVARDYVKGFIKCAEARTYVVEEIVRPGDPVGHPSDFQNPFQSCLTARERLIARASIAQLASGKNEFASCVATIYRDLVKLYRCYDVYRAIVLKLLTVDQPAHSPGWSCIIGFSQYPTDEAGTKEHCE